MFLFDRTSQHHAFASTLRDQCKAPLRCADLDQPPKHPSKPPYLGPPTPTMRFVDEPCPERSCQKQVSRHVSGPGFRQRACEGEQHRTPCERNEGIFVTYEVSARIHDKDFGLQQSFNIFEQ